MIRGFQREKPMQQDEAEDFVARFAHAWATKDGDAFLALWHPDGELHSPIYDRVILGRELGRLNELQRKATPALVWELLSWTCRGDIVHIEWKSSNRYGERVVSWCGVDRMTLENGRIREEIVYVDTAPLQAMKMGIALQPLIHVPR